ncbi:Gfo/Idh/MocA family oxidoreductase [Agromyces intestinalis]|uniref:Gfo/Idh/MocA family oxidoreductase n=1 Tax=Agromyces intestinalis TaxID=2592652 RepID=A0A5C1YE89_9MICO|nr:Gfo/Idh/MocA family oxidoreductase [Agromyces intestinalis]QEO13988.1 Gfo/Idh/MocA family oxidoreductase [Agromyces intestinalis]
MTTDVSARARTLRAGFVGGGFMAAVHSRAARAAGAALEGAASSSPEASVSAAERLGLSQGYASLDDLIADVDVVHVCTPNATHVDIATRALEAGRHVICEKPLATDIAGAEALAALAADRGVVAAVPFVYRFHPMAREARARVAAGETGRLLGVQGAYLQDWLAAPGDDDWRVDPAQGGPSRAFADIGSHLVDLLEFVSGDRIVRLNAATRTAYRSRATNTDIATEDLVAVVVELASGAIGTLLVSQVAPGHKNGLVLELAGTDASVRFEQERPETLWIGRTDVSSIVERDPARLSADAARLSIVPAGHPMGYQDAFNAFVADAYAAVSAAEAGASEAPDGLPTFVDGVRAVRVTEAVLASAASGQWVEVRA